MFIEGVTVCINCGDFLSETLPRNRSLFNHFVVVTSPEDNETEIVAEDCGCQVVKTERYLDDGSFNKGKALNDGLAECSRRQWLCIVDSDIVLPSDLQQVLRKRLRESLPGTVYGMQRRMCQSVHEWEEFLVHSNLEAFPLEVQQPPWRVVPVGFFQLWKDWDGPISYPENYPTASDSDIAFSNQFPIHDHLDVECIHLSSETWVHGTDYSGRKSPRWVR